MFVGVGLGNGRMVYLFQQAGCGIKASVRWAESASRQVGNPGQVAAAKIGAWDRPP